jgi:hypothetical protein
VTCGWREPSCIGLAGMASVIPELRMRSAF